MLYVALVLAVYRLTRLTAIDEITSTPREWLHTKFARRPHLQYLTSCPFCQSGYWSAGAVLITNAFFCPIPLPFLAFLAIWGAVSIIFSITTHLESDD